MNTTPVPYVLTSAVPQNGLILPNKGAVTFNATVTAPGGVITDMDSVRSAQLDHEVFDAAIETLLDLWVARYGNEWVDIDKIMNDEFFALAYKRLRSLGQLEQHYLTDRARFVCRKPT